jgi:hypothetical protein
MAASGLCRFRHTLQAPGTGVHSVRFLGVAFVDLAITLMAALLLARASGLSPWLLFGLLLVLGVLVHRLFCVDTALNKRIFS